MNLEKGFFALFPKITKVRNWVRTRVRECPPGSSSTPAPQVCARLWEWVMVLTDQEPYCWDRVTGETRWRMEAGYTPSWCLRPDGCYIRLGDGEIFETLDCSDVGYFLVRTVHTVQQTLEISQVQFFGWLVTRLSLCNDRCLGWIAKKTVECPQLQCCGRRPVPRTRLLCSLVQRLWVAQCLVRLWIHVIIQGGFSKNFDDFLREGEFVS